MHRLRTAFVCLMLLCTAGREASAQHADLTLFAGRAYPVYDERLTIRPSLPSLPGFNVTVSGDPLIRTDGGLVIGGALAFEVGVIGIEGRIDSTDVGFDLSGATYDLRGSGVSGRVTIGDGRFDAHRFNLLSGNVRLRTPGPIGVFVSGGLSVLPDVTIGGSVPVSVQIAAIPVVSGLQPGLRLRVAPGESGHRVGANAGAGLRIGAGRIAAVGEVRGFFFRDYELRLEPENAPDFVTTLLGSFEPVRFQPIIVNAQAGLVLRF